MVGHHIPTVLVIFSVLVAYRLFGVSEFFETLSRKEIQKQYDYVIVGGGTAGAVLAARLSEDAKSEILLIEAGGDESRNPAVEVPIFADQVRGSEADWSYRTVPQRHACKGHVDGVSIWPAGKGLGGSSNLNYMQYLRGSRHDYDDWAAHGAHGWAYKDVLPYFIKSEDNRNGEYVRTVFHGFGGRLSVSDIELSPVTRIMTSAYGEMGIKRRDVNGRSQYGFAATQATTRYGTRCGSYKAFLKQAKTRDNLHILTFATAKKILFEKKRAVGVLYTYKGEDLTVKARKEVLLAAGTVGSTKLLLLSGVGPRNHLQALKVPVVADLPVGDNLQDHVMADGVQYFSDHYMSISAARAENFLTSWYYTLFGAGMKGSPRFREGTAFVRTRYQPAHIRYPLIAFHSVASVNAYEAEQLNVKEEVWNSIHGKPPTRDGLTIFPVLLHPRSKGTVRLKSNNPEDPPLINPNYLADTADVKILVEGMHFLRKLGKTKAFGDWELQLNDKILPQCAEHGNWTDMYMECYLRHISLSGYAPVGTCKMGAPGDPTAVVDPILRVRGVKGLRVVDASIIPNAISGNAYAVQIMIAEKASDMIREKDTVKPIKEYFKHLIATKHKKFAEEEDEVHQQQKSKDEEKDNEEDKKDKKYKKNKKH